MKILQMILISLISLIGTGYFIANFDAFHKGPSGFGSVTRPYEICSSVQKMNGNTNDKGEKKVAIVTGSSFGGIGFETAKALLECGYSVSVPGRNLKQSEETAQRLKNVITSSTTGIEIFTGELQLDDFKSVRKFASDFKKLGQPLHVLIGNAGVMALPNRTLTKQGYEMQMGVNHLGHALLFNELQPLLEKSQPSRVIAVSSLAVRLSTTDDWLRASSTLESVEYDPWRAYGNSKMANVLFARQLDHVYKDKGIRAFSLNRK
jgi:NAD(P)-dependent dehydrogenase (short-subunit alcohol dehydrogenase family)